MSPRVTGDAGDDSDGERDAWLREALRHAPDAALAAPPRLREAILAEARAAVAVDARRNERRTGTGPHPLLAFWSWLARPPVAAGFASVMAATLVGMMWWDRPLDETLVAPRSEQAVPAPSPAPVPLPEAPAAPMVPMAPRLTQAERPKAAVPAPAAPATPPATRDAAAFPAEAKRQANAAAPADEARAARKQSAEASADALGQAPAATAVSPPAPPAQATETQAAAGATESASDRTADSARERSASAFARMPAPEPAPAPAATPSPSRRADAPPALLRGEAAASAGEPIAPLLAAIAADRSRWSRVGADGRPTAVDEALWRWLGELDAASAGRWRTASPPFAKTEPAASASVELHRDARPAATLSVDGRGSVTLQTRLDGPERAWRAEIEPGPAARLRSDLPRAR